jgi:lipoprotein-releasing system ATP-binding protein
MKSNQYKSGHEPHLSVHGLEKSYTMGVVQIPVLRGIEFEVQQGEFVAIIGQSGSGKSTLLHLMGTLDAPDNGQIFLRDRPIHALPSRQRDRLRNDTFGMIFQFYHLLPEMTTLENVLSPLMIRSSFLGYWKKHKENVETAKELIDAVGLGHRLHHKPRELSGGEMQRAAIARALVTNPELLLADEPTGNLDKNTGQEIMQLLTSLKQERNLTIVMVTHDQSLARRADRVVGLVDGRIAQESTV